MTSLLTVFPLLSLNLLSKSALLKDLFQGNLSQNEILFIFCAACFAGYFIAYIKKRPTALLSIVGRGAAGLSFIYLFNFFCAARDIVTGIGINPITGAVCTVLGIPGAILLYSLKIYSFL